MPDRDTPPKLVEAWLEFHREKLCRDLDAVFAFDGPGMEIWCRSEENRSFRKLQRIIEPLRNSQRVDLYVTRPPQEKEDDEGVWSDLPPSLVENRELQTYLRPRAWPNAPAPRVITVVTDGEENTQVQVFAPGFPDGAPLSVNTSDRILLSRLYVYARSIMKDNWIMSQYAADIPELIRTAQESAFEMALRRHAREVCREHVKDLAKSVGGLRKDLSHAFPKAGDKKTRESGKKKESTVPSSPPTPSAFIERAEAVAANARVLSSRVHRFIYPTEHTVSLDDLRQPGLTASLEALEADIRDFERELAHLSVS